MNGGNQMTNKERPSDETPLVELKIERRRFLGKGIKAAPFVITLVSQPALGTTCFTPSRSLSKNTSISQQGKNGECTGAESPGNYMTQQTPGAAYHWPASVPPSTPFHPLFAGTRFNVTNGSVTTSMTLGGVLSTGPQQDPDKVAFHLIGAYLNVKGGNGAVIPSNVMTAQGILDIWAEFTTKGYYEPMAGVKWYAEGIKKYLIENGIVK